MIHDLREMLRLAAGRNPQPTAAIFDRQTLQSKPQSGGRADYDGYKRKRGSKVHIDVDTLGNLLAVYVTPADERVPVAELAAQVQETTEQNVTLAYVYQSYTGPEPAEAAKEAGMALEIIRLPEAKKTLVTATPLGRGAQFCVGYAVSPPGQRQ